MIMFRGMLTDTQMAMCDSAPLVRLMTMLSPTFPVGAFSFSSGLEQAAAAGLVRDETSLREWLHDVLHAGTLWNDAVLLAEGWRQAGAGEINELPQVNELALALAGSAGRFTETTAQGAAFAEALKSWPESERIACPPETPLPVIVGAACQAGGIALEDGLSGFLQAFVSNQLQAAIRLSVIGQTGAARLLAKLEPMLVKAAGDADGATLDHLGSATVMAEIASMNHETLDGRLFRS